MRTPTKLFLFLLVVVKSYGLRKLEEKYRWTALDYAYPDDNARDLAIFYKEFIPENNLPVGIEIWNNKLFVTVPRWRPGIPSTLNYISLDTAPSLWPPLIPYPTWQSNELGNCATGLNTVYRIKADECDRLWVLDTGTFGIGNTTQNLCPYTLNIYDLRTDRKIRRYVLRPEDTNSATFIANIAVDVGQTCDDAYAYMSDELGYGLIVYSWAENTSWRFAHSYFLPDPLRGEFQIQGLDFRWGEEGIFGMALSPPVQRSRGNRILFFSPLASYREFIVLTSTLKNSSKSADESLYYKDFMALPERGDKTHTTARVIDQLTGIQLYNFIDQNAVGCWNSHNVVSVDNMAIVDSDDEALVFPADVKIDRGGNVWVISDRMSTFLLAPERINFSEDANFRIFSASLGDLVAGTVCDANALY